MPSTVVPRMTLILTLKRLSPLALLTLGACSWSSWSLPSWPDHLVYKVDVQQGTVITKEMAAQLRPGMTREQVRFVLGTSPLIDPFHANRWDYTYYFKPGSGTPVERRFTVFFDANDKMVKFDGDPLVTEAEFISTRIQISTDEAKKGAVDENVVLPGGPPPPTAGPDAGPAPSAPSPNLPATPPAQAPATDTDKPSPSIFDRVKGWFSDSPVNQSKSVAPSSPNGPGS